MKKKLMYFLFLLLISSPFFSASASPQHSSEKMVENKLYVKPESIIINDDGIFLLLNDEILPIKELYTDENGIFTPKMLVWCENGHRTKCWMCGGCEIWYCQYRCKCSY